MKMSQIIIVVMLLFLTLMIPWSNVQAEMNNKGGHAGGGSSIQIPNGESISLYQYAKDKPDLLDKIYASESYDHDLPEISSLKRFIIDFPFWDEQFKNKLLKSIDPDFGIKKYLKVENLNFIDEAAIARIKAGYERVYNDLDIHKEPSFDAITTWKKVDTIKTYLLPNFFKLTPNAKMSKLLHEALWTTFQSIDLKLVLAIEVSFEQLLETYISAGRDFSKVHPDILSRFIGLLPGDASSGLYSSLKMDEIFNRDAFQKLKEEYTVKNVLGVGFIRCFSEATINFYESCKGFFQFNLSRLGDTLKGKYNIKESYFVSFLLKKFERIDFIFHWRVSRYCNESQYVEIPIKEFEYPSGDFSNLVSFLTKGHFDFEIFQSSERSLWLIHGDSKGEKPPSANCSTYYDIMGNERSSECSKTSDKPSSIENKLYGIDFDYRSTIKGCTPYSNPTLSLRINSNLNN